MDKKTMEKIIGFVKGTDLTEFSLVKDDSKVHFRRQAAKKQPQDQPSEKQSAAAAAGEKPQEKTLSICSLMVGTFYHSPSSDRPPFVVEGSKVMPGQKVGVIEAMKVMKDVLSAVEGRIVKIKADNGSHVEYGQELFTVGPE